MTCTCDDEIRDELTRLLATSAERIAARIEAQCPYMRSFASNDYLTGYAHATERAAHIARTEKPS